MAPQSQKCKRRVWKDTDNPFFDYMKEDTELTRLFASYMKNVTSGKGTSIQHLLIGYDWASLGEVTVVDVYCIYFPHSERRHLF